MGDDRMRQVSLSLSVVEDNQLMSSTAVQFSLMQDTRRLNFGGNKYGSLQFDQSALRALVEQPVCYLTRFLGPNYFRIMSLLMISVVW